MKQPPLSGDPPAFVDIPLRTIGFEIDHLSPTKVSGHLLVTEKNCQAFKVLHGGVSALIAESLASTGAYFASGCERVAGIQLTINHVKSAQLGDFVVAEATPINVGRSIQVWEVILWKCVSLNSDSRTLIASSRLTLFCNFALPESAKNVGQGLKKLARL